MKVLLIHEHGRAFGSGAVIAMYRLHRALQKAGVESTIACRRRQLDGEDIVELPRADRIEDFLGSITWRLGLNDIHCVSSFKITSFKPFLEADVVNTHGLHTNYFNYLALPRMAKRKPLIATLHDMWHFTGHCGYNQNCQRWKTGCGRCPDLTLFPPVSRDATAIEWRLKNWVYRRTSMTVVSPSRWLADLARQSMLARFEIHHIPNAVDIEVFRPRNRSESRAMIGLPQHKHVVMFASAALDNYIKGADLLIRALQRLPRAIKDNTVLLLLGDRAESIRNAVDIPATSLGYIADDQHKAIAYSAADMFVLPSRSENHSLVLLEAMACGTPGVAFKVGGTPEIVRHNNTGYIAALGDTEDLCRGITRLLEDHSYREQLSRNCRQMIVSEFSLTQHAQRYIALYERVLSGRTTAHMPAAAASAANGVPMHQPTISAKRSKVRDPHR